MIEYQIPSPTPVKRAKYKQNETSTPFITGVHHIQDSQLQVESLINDRKESFLFWVITKALSAFWIIDFCRLCINGWPSDMSPVTFLYLLSSYCLTLPQVLRVWIPGKALTIDLTCSLPQGPLARVLTRLDNMPILSSLFSHYNSFLMWVGSF